MKFDLVIVAGGSGNRAGGDKLKFLLRDSTVLERTIDAFLRIPNIEKIIVVLRQEDVDWGEEIKEKLEQAEELIMNLGKAIAESDVGQDLRDLTMLVSEEMKLQMVSENPLFAKTVGAFRKEWK